jgi:hypothetical protein
MISLLIEEGFVDMDIVNSKRLAREQKHRR